MYPPVPKLPAPHEEAGLRGSEEITLRSHLLAPGGTPRPLLDELCTVGLQAPEPHTQIPTIEVDAAWTSYCRCEATERKDSEGWLVLDLLRQLERGEA